MLELELELELELDVMLVLKAVVLLGLGLELGLGLDVMLVLKSVVQLGMGLELELELDLVLVLKLEWGRKLELVWVHVLLTSSLMGMVILRAWRLGPPPLQAAPGAWMQWQMPVPCYRRMDPACAIWISYRSCVARVLGDLGTALPSDSSPTDRAWALPLLCFAVAQPQCCGT